MLDKRCNVISAYLLVRVSIFVIFCVTATIFTYKSYHLLQNPDVDINLISRLQGPLSSDNPLLIKTLRNEYLEHPTHMPYNLTEDDEANSGYFLLHNRYTSKMIHHYINYLFGQQHSGFFIEAGALDGQFLSNTLWLEKDRGWDGLLIEADPFNYKLLINKRRHAWISNTCLSFNNYPYKTLIKSMQQLDEDWGDPWVYRARSEIYDPRKGDREIVERMSTKSYSNVQCFPLLSYLLALNVTTVDFLSLDIQGHEWDVLKTLPLKQSKIRVIAVEHYVTDQIGQREITKKWVADHSFIKYMEVNGYHILDFDHEPNYLFILGTEKKLIDIAKNERSPDGR
ncbi:unnamed protein product, partial [Meganyctiphanes norvegica]